MRHRQRFGGIRGFLPFKLRHLDGWCFGLNEMGATYQMMFRSIADESEVEALVSLSVKQDASSRWVTGLLERGESRLQWCRMARSDDGELLAAQVFDSWSPEGDPGDVPRFVQLLGHTDEAAGVGAARP